VAGHWLYPGTLVSSRNKTDSHYIAEILFKVVLNTHKPTDHHNCAKIDLVDAES